MYESILSLHSYWAFAVLGFLTIATLNSLVGMSKRREFMPKDRQISMIALIFSHVQFVIGLILVFLTPKLDAAKAAGMGGVMKDASLRLFFVEHPLVNLIAIILITVGWSKHKKAAESNAKFKSIAVFYALGIVLLLSRIPWSQWLNG
ncbi:MAG: hypothetical protein EOO45_26850 [Flavobacterium sp.]|nr:MAG: hypothetical protein EOO45_26850 [Flavobacterium sp.]